MVNNVENWKYKSRAELEALSLEQLIELQKNLFDAIKLFHNAHTAMTDEMFWQMCVIPDVINKKENG